MSQPPSATSAPGAPGDASACTPAALLGAPLTEWLVTQALPRWAAVGVDHSGGGFFEKIGFDGQPREEPRRARVVARQIYVFATAERHGWLPGAGAIVDHGLAFLLQRMRRADGTIVASVRADGTPVDDRFDLYEHAFVLFALAAASRALPAQPQLHRHAVDLLACMRLRWAHPLAGFEEAEPRTLPLKSNPHMHLLEAALAWVDAAPPAAKPGWQRLATELVDLCLDRFIDGNGALHEYFDGDWRFAPGAPGRLVEPGHQFEWAWLLMRAAGHATSPTRAVAAARRLLETGERHGVDRERGVAINAIDDGFAVVDAAAKLWPQTERVKAWHGALTLAGPPPSMPAEPALASAIAGLQRYLAGAPAGLWHEQLAGDGRFEHQDCRASSLYHIVCAIDTLNGG